MQKDIIKNAKLAIRNVLLGNNFYVIEFTGLFEHGYVRTVLFLKGKERYTRFEKGKEAFDFATKYRFKWYANFLCWLYNMSSDRNFELRTFSVRKYLRNSS